MDLKRIDRTVVYKGKIIDLIVDEIEYPSGSRGIREIAHHPGGAVTVPLMDDNSLIFVRQLRYPLGERLLELPAGKLAPGEDPALCAVRELAEETGWKAERFQPLSSIVTTPGFCDEILYLYLATGLREAPGGHQREEGEFSMSVEIHPFERALAMVERGEIWDAKTIIGILLAEKHLKKH